MKNRKHDIERYLRGELSPAEMHALEREALNDPFLAEALEGVEQTGTDNFLYDLHALTHSLRDRTRKRKGKTIRMWGWTTGIAATVLLVAVSGFLVVSVIREQNDRRQAMLQQSTVDGKQEPPVDTVASALENPAPPPTPAKEQRATHSRASDNTEDQQARAQATREETHNDQAAARPVLPRESDDVQSKDAEQKNAASTDEQAGKEIANADTEAVPDAEIKIPDTSVGAEGALRKSAGERKSAMKEKDYSTRKRKPTDRTVLQPGVTPAVSSAPVPLKGKVVSAEDGEGLPGVTVLVKGTAIGSVTDANGNYSIDLPSLDSQLLFSFVGFETKEIAAGGRPRLDVQLKEDVNQLNEVIVTGYGSASNETVEQAAAFRPAEPQGGKSAFRKYLLQSLRYPDDALTNKAEGKVTVRFTVQPDGVLTGFEVLKGIGYGCDEELIRLIKSGPAWQPAMQADKPVIDQVKVRFRFELPG